MSTGHLQTQIIVFVLGRAHVDMTKHAKVWGQFSKGPDDFVNYQLLHDEGKLTNC